MRLCKNCWRELMRPAPDTKPSNFTGTPKTRVYAEFWCPRCHEPADGYVTLPVPENVAMGMDERRTKGAVAGPP